MRTHPRKKTKRILPSRVEDRQSTLHSWFARCYSDVDRWVALRRERESPITRRAAHSGSYPSRTSDSGLAIQANAGGATRRRRLGSFLSRAMNKRGTQKLLLFVLTLRSWAAGIICRKRGMKLRTTTQKNRKTSTSLERT